jgi:hypothetical protein
VSVSSLKVKAAASGNGRTPLIFGITTNQQALGLKVSKSKLAYGIYSFSDEPLPSMGSVEPIANFKAGHLPINIMQSTAANQRFAPLQKD